MRKLGLTGLCLALASALLAACKSAPEPSPAAPTAAEMPSAPPAPPTQPGPSAAPWTSAAAPGPSTSAAALAPAGVPAKVYGETTKTIAARTGDRFVVVLPGNITTPYRWRLAPVPDGSAVRLVEEKYNDAAPPGCAGCTGYDGARSFTLEARADGTVKLHFAYVNIATREERHERDLTVEVTVSGP